MKRAPFAVALAALGLASACGEDFGEDLREEAAPCVPPPRPPGKARTEPAFPRLAFSEPTRLVRPADGTPRWYLAERTGVIRTFEDRADADASAVFADLRDRIFFGSVDDGVMGLALHPRFGETGEVFIGYTAPSASAALEYRIDRARSRDGGRTLDLSTLENVLAFSKEQSIHHGGPLAFGPDGLLYAAIGDGFFGDPHGHAQRLDVLFGKVLRIDVDGARPYAVPKDNPFAEAADARGEIWALGFRNPWTMSFDRATGDLWLGDVGHGLWEEIDLVRRGGNYGWREREGAQCYDAPACRREGMTDPVFQYPHSDGFSITGAFVYRGKAMPELEGAFVFGDFVTGRVSALRGGSAETLLESGRQISAFAEDRDGEVLLVDFATGTIHRMLREDRPAQIPERLSESRCFDAPGLFRYEVNSSLWSDGADKERALYLPPGQPIVVGADGAWELPPGSVTWKTFVKDGRKVETRMFVNHVEGGWAGYTYAWDDEGRDATLLERGETRGGWTFPSRSDCLACHNRASGRTLGLSTAQMSRGDQIARLAARGAFAEPPAPARIEDRARAYLDANCSLCHRPRGPASGLGDLRAGRSLPGMKICNVPASAGDPGVMRVVPGDPDRSAIVQRMRALDTTRMPPIASHVVDEEGVALVSEWIRGIDPELCPIATFPKSP